MTVILLTVFGLYFIFILALLYGWEKALLPIAESESEYLSIAIVVPFRNEAGHIEQLLTSLNQIQYPKEKLEIILVNDHSSDKSIKLIEQFNLINLRSIHLPVENSGKKAAITWGVEQATGDVIVTTDADCIHHPGWLKSINNLFQAPTTQLVVGPVSIKHSSSFFSKLQAIEFASLISSGAALLQWKLPAMANGANLAFRRQAFFDVKGYEGNEHIPSGDDEYLLRKIFKAYPGGVVFNNQPEAVVTTESQPSLFAFFQQRLRWAGKWKFQTDIKLKVVGVLVFFFQLIFLGTLFLAIDNNQLAAILLLAKAGLEGIFLWRVCQFLNVKFSLIPFALLQLFYPLYVVITAISSLFLPFEWKGRKS